MSNKYFALFVFLSLFLFQATDYRANSKINLRVSKEEPKSQFWINTKDCSFSMLFVKQMLEIAKQYPGKSLTGLAGLLTYANYSTEIQDFFKQYKQECFIAGLATLGLAYVTKNAWLHYLPDSEEDEDLQEDEEVTEESEVISFSKTPVRIFAPGEIKTTLKDVAGLQAAKEDLSDVVMFLTDSTKFEKIGAKIPKGILLHGSPGNGKTLLARAVAGEVRCPFLYVNASQFEEAFVGIGAARIRHLFTIAKELAPCVVFIDEIDSVGRKRSASSHTSSEFGQTLNQLLAQMDGFEQQENPIVVIGATNRPDVLDSALTRPGRFDRKVEIASPYINDRYKILQMHIKNIKVGDGIDVYKIARGTPGYSGADLAHLVNEAAIVALREGQEEVTMLHFDQARDYINLGRETEGMNISDEEYWQTAVHEAGHALARVLQADAMPLHKVTIKPRAGALGITFAMNKESHHFFEQEMKAEIVVKLAGSVAEEMLYAGRGAGASSDLKSARALATEMVMVYGMTQEFKDVTFAEYLDAQVHLPDEISTKIQNEVTRIIHECRHIATELLLAHKDELIKLTDMLVEQGTVYGSAVYELCGVTEPNIQYSLS